ncbi:RNA binding effector protein-like protein Scp160 [Saccharata proteae CBS 121410]|uniref:RNA binding effector protein-like protein Scp160 n=1 Tax=Saccharata proteae CBS 121410 TaxID=1314787 RepID=A0A9P4I1Q7_9PEZI|nr:RNA binding effector protein-like protein Scp160 [Saccharata proteae CBS 121410]
MAAETTNGEGLTAAQKLEQRLAAEEAHRVTIEDAVDEEDLAHPPPSASVSATPDTAPSPAPMSEKVAGKQKAQDAPTTTPAGNAGLNLSEENFPGLGAPKARPSAAMPSPWSRKPASVNANGVNGSAKSVASSRASTPAAGNTTPNSGVPTIRGPVPQMLNIPGRNTESIVLAPDQLMPRDQLKRPVKDVLLDISKHSKARVEMRESPQGWVFQATGPVDDARQALKEVAKQLGKQLSIKVPIPASTKMHVIGRGGATIQNIQKKSGARVHMPKQDDSAASPDDEDATIEVSVEGDSVSAAMAKAEIEKIVNERTSSVNLRVKEIPAEFYPFLAGPHNSSIEALESNRDLHVQIPHYHTWREQAPQPSPAGQPVQFAPQASYPIQISGDRVAAQEARAELERRANELRRQLIINQMPIERGRHQFIIGERGGSLHDFLAETGCAVILPPSSDDSEILTVVGPADKIENGINKVMDLASAMQATNVDIARQHANSQAHARALTRYLRQRKAIAELERMHDASIVLPVSTDGPTGWEIYSRDAKNGMRARMDIMNLISGHPPTRLANMDVDPFFHQHLRQRAAQKLRSDMGVHVVFPEDDVESPQLVLVYEGQSAPSEYQFPRGQPSASEIQAFQRSLQEAQQHIASLISGQDQIVGRDLEAPQKFHDKIRRYVDREQQGLPQGQIPVQVLFGNARPQAAQASNHSLFMRGPNSAVEDLEQKILAFIEQEKKDELERGYTTSFDYPQKFANVLIGKRGENIRKLREEFDVEIQVQDGKVELKGPKAKADAAKAHILALARKLEDEATYILKIKPQFHRDLIGAKGAQVNRLQDRYNVRVNFPRSAAAAQDDDAGSEAPQRNSRQAADEVVVRGPKRGADAARDELLELLQYTIDNSHTATVSVANNQIPSLIGAGGREMENLRSTTGAQIEVPNVRDAADPSGRAELKVKGTKKQVEEAKKMLEERAKVFDETVVRTIEIDKKHHKALIGSGGSNLREIVIKAGGPDDRREQARMVRFPRAENDENTIRVEGTKPVVDKIVAAFEEAIKTRDSQVTEVLEVIPEKHRLLIGRGGETRKGLESQFNVSVDIPKQNAPEAVRSLVRISGQPDDVTKAKEHIQSLVKDQPGETVEVPRSLHHAIADNGQFFRRMRNDHQVTVDHAGQQPPPKPTTAGASNPRAKANGGALPLITDDPSAAAENTHAWEIVDNSPMGDDSEAGTIPWVLRSSNAQGVAKAKAILQKAIEEKSKPSSTGYLILPDPKLYRHVVGPGGSQINSIRKKTGTKVQVPRGGEGNEAIEIVGTREGVEEARDLILETVRGKK